MQVRYFRRSGEKVYSTIYGRLERNYRKGWEKIRKKIFDILNKLYPTFSIGQHEGLCTSPYQVLKFNEQMTSNNNTNCGWRIFKVLCYCPKSSIVLLDSMVEGVKQTLESQGFESTGNITPDFLDDTVQGYMGSIEFRIPKEI